MKIKKDYYVLFAVILILSIYLFQRKSNRELYQIPQISKITKSDISKIKISKSGKSIVLDKKDNKWQIAPEGYPAAKHKINNMLDTIGGLTLTAMVSESKNFNRYDLDNEKKISVKAFAGSTLQRKFDIGKAASTFSHTFIKLDDDHRVYHAKENFRKKFDQSVDDLRDKLVLTFDKNKIEEIELKQNENTIKLIKKKMPEEKKADKDKTSSTTKEETVWLGEDGKKGNKTKIDSLLGTLSRLLCQKFINNLNKNDLKDPVFTVRLKGTKEYSLSLFNKKDAGPKSYLAVSSENDYPFELSDMNLDDIMIKPEDMLV